MGWPPGTCRFGIGCAANSRRHGLAMMPRPSRRSIDAGAVGGDAGVRVHLPVQLRDQHERQPRLDRLHALRPPPDLIEAVEPIPDRLRPLADLVGRHHRVRRVDLRPRLLRDQPVPGDRHAGDLVGRIDGLLPRREIDRAGERRQHHELRECQIRLLGERGRRVERRRVDRSAARR